MPDRAHIVSVCNRYVELVSAGDTDGIVDLYADDCWIEDPIGSERKVGKDALRAFYGGIAELEVNPVMTRFGPVCVAGNEAAFQFELVTKADGVSYTLAPIDVMTFDDDGRVTSMKAFWEPDRTMASFTSA